MPDSLQRVTLTASSGQKVQAAVITVFEREEMGHETAAPTFHNLAAAIFSAHFAVSRVMLLHTRGGLLLFVFEAAHQWFDVRSEPVQIMKAKGTYE